jgi:phosphate transport system protein
MQKHYEREVNELVTILMEQLERVQTNTRIALSPYLADEGGAGDGFIDDKTLDQNEVIIEEECLKIIALHQPVADELRFLTTVIKTNYNLERIGDLLKEIHALKVDHPHVSREIGDEHPGLLPLFSSVRDAVTEACHCLAERSAPLAKQVWSRNLAIDQHCKSTMLDIRSALKQRPATDSLLDALLCVRYAERIADHAANVAKEVLYLATGEIVRHRRREILG